MAARRGLGGSLGGWGARSAHRATANETHRADDDAAQAVGDCQADRADGGDLPVEEPLEEVGGDQGGIWAIVFMSSPRICNHRTSQVREARRGDGRLRRELQKK